MRRRLSTILSAISFLCFLCVAAAWIRSWQGHPLFAVNTHFLGTLAPRSYTAFHTDRRGFVLNRFRLHPHPDPSSSSRPGASVAQSLSDFSYRFAGFEVCRLDGRPRSSMAYFRIVIPYWFAAIASLGLPALWFRRFLGKPTLVQRRLAAGLCVACGYDLRASKDKCPECGNPIPSLGVKTPT